MTINLERYKELFSESFGNPDLFISRLTSEERLIALRMEAFRYGHGSLSLTKTGERSYEYPIYDRDGEEPDFIFTIYSDENIGWNWEVMGTGGRFGSGESFGSEDYAIMAVGRAMIALNNANSYADGMKK